MKHFSKSTRLILVALSVLITVSSCGKKLEPGVIYEFHSQSQTSDVGAKVNTKSSEYDLKTKDFSVYFRIFENGLTDLILKSDSINYSFSGEYQFLEGKGEYDNVYSFILNGKDFNMEYERPTMFNFMIDPSDNRVYSMPNGTFPKLTETFLLSELSSEDYKNEYQDGLINSFLPLVNMSLYPEEVKNLDDYWINYLEINDEIERREDQKRNEEQREKTSSKEKNSAKSVKRPDKITLSMARNFMQERLANINQQLVASFESNIEGYTVYAFFSNSIDRPGYSCVSMVPDFELNVLASDCNLSRIKVREWNAIPGSPKIY